MELTAIELENIIKNAFHVGITFLSNNKSLDVEDFTIRRNAQLKQLLHDSFKKVEQEYANSNN